MWNEVLLKECLYGLRENVGFYGNLLYDSRDGGGGGGWEKA